MPREQGDEMMLPLLHRIQSDHPGRQSVIENVPLDALDPGVFETTGYAESFRRVQLQLFLGAGS